MITLATHCQTQLGPRPIGPAAPVLGARDVDVWSTLLDHPAEQRLSLAALLSETEQKRAERFHFKRDCNRFIAGRAFMRIILSRYLRTKPEQIDFAYGPSGKPFLTGPVAHRELHFNLAHSQGRALLAVTRSGPVGVDLEFIRVLEELESLVARFFSPREVILFDRLPPDQKPTAFFRLWTRKEAWLKAVGAGIAHLLARVEVSFCADEEVRLLRVPQNFGPLSQWFLGELSTPAGFCAALSVRATAPVMRCWDWEASREEGLS